MRKIYSLVLMAAMLFLGTTAWATSYSVGSGDYATFAAFWSAKGASLTSADEITLAGQLDLNAGTYDFNGATLNCQGYRLKIGSASTYTIKDVTINADKYAFMVAAAATVNLENVTLNSNGTATTKDGAAIYVNASATNAVLNLDANTTITGADNTKGSGIWAISKVTINNSGTISGRQYGIYSTVALSLVNDGTIQNCYNGVYFTPNAASTFVNNGTVQTCTNYGVYVRPVSGSESAAVEITNNGTISAKYYGLYLYSTSYASTVTNYSLIKGTSINNNGMAVYARQANVVNYGTITHTSGKATTNGIISHAAHITNEVGGTIRAIYIASGQSETGNLITNNGTIQFGVYTVIYSNTAKTTVYPVKAYITNEGELTQTFDGQGYLYITNNGTATITKGTYEQAVTFEGSNNTLIEGGEFLVAPEGSMGYINPGDGAIKFAEGVGSLTIAPGYAWRSIDQMVTPVGGVVEVTHSNGSTRTCLIEEAFADAANGDVITLVEDVTSYSRLWLGTAAQEDAKISLTLDLNGHTLNSAKNVKRTIELTHGALYIINSVPGQGGIKHLRSNTGDNSSDVIYVCGSTLKDVNPRTADIANLFTYLLVDEGVNIIAEGDLVNGVSVFELGHDYGVGANLVSGVTYETNIYSNYLNWSGEENKQMGVANGVRIDIKGNIDVQKYGVKPNGNIRSALEFLPEHAGDGILASDTAYSPFIHIFPTAVVRTSDALTATAIYASGYARWLIEGTCQGATGVYAKSGMIDFDDAIIESTYTGDATITTGKGGGIAAGGNAVVIESNGHYTGDHSLVVSGDTKITTEADGGAAIVDVVDNNHESKVDDITINGGSFTGDYAIVISSETATEESAEVVVNGVTVVGEITVGGSSAPSDVADIMGDNTHTTEVENPDGSKTVIISAGEAPAAKTEWVDVAALTPGSDAKWTGFTAGVIGDGTAATTVTLGELQIISGYKEDAPSTVEHFQQLTIKKKSTLKVDKLIMNDYARIIVEAGAKLIVEGTQGINAPSTDNILLKTSETEQAIFLFNPAVSSNRHPNATVELSSSSYRNSAEDRHFHRFGIPMISGVSSIDATPAVPAVFYKYDYENDTWLNIGVINYSGTPLDLTQMSDPFEYYQLLCNVGSGNTTTFTFTGSLVGNDDPSKTIAPDDWYGVANSYTGAMGLDEIVNNMTGTMSKSIWTYETSGPSKWVWKAANLATQIFDGKMYVKPMQAFLIHNVSDDASSVATFSYEKTVWNPAMGISPAPARLSAASLTAAKMIVSSENGYGDQVLLVQGSNFTSDFDNGYDAEKYFNGDINFYISADRAMSVLATDDLRDTYLGFSCVNGGIYTIDFSNVQGEQYDLVDLEANRTIHMTEGASYQFAANDNEQNDYRFRIVARQEMPTDMETVETAKPANGGVYTITGQYLGDLNIWNTLPAGLYIVNGEKKVK